MNRSILVIALLLTACSREGAFSNDPSLYQSNTTTLTPGVQAVRVGDGGPAYPACASSGVVVNVSPEGEAYLPLRAAPFAEAQEVARLGEGAKLFLCQRSLDQRWGRHSVDLFASRHNRQCRRYFSRRRDPQAAASDALLQNWATERNPYAHPPFSLLSRVLAQVERQCVPEMTLVAPDWAASWLPDLRRLAVEPPVVLPHTATLIAPATPTPWKKSRPLWKTLAWRVSGLS